MSKFYIFAFAAALSVSASAASPDSSQLIKADKISQGANIAFNSAEIKGASGIKATKSAQPKVAKDFSTIEGICGKYNYTFNDYWDGEGSEQIVISADSEAENGVIISGIFENNFEVKATVDLTEGTINLYRQQISGFNICGGILSGTQVSFQTNYIGEFNAENGTITFNPFIYYGVSGSDGFYFLRKENVFTAVSEDDIFSASIKEDCNDSDKFVFNIQAGKNYSSFKGYAIAGFYGNSQSNLEFTAKSGSVLPGKAVSLNLEGKARGVYTFLIAGLNADGELIGGDAIHFYVSNHGDDDWVTLDGKATYSDDYIYSLYSAQADDMEVDVQKSKSKEGIYRLVNAYGEGYTYASQSAHDALTHNHYLYINAEDPDKVYIEQSALGVDFGTGSVIGTSMVAHQKSQNAQESDYDIYYGKLDKESRTITFPEKALLCFELGDPNGGMFYANKKNNFKVVLPSSAFSGIQSVDNANDDAPAEYYNLQGIKVENPGTGFYILRQGSKVSKVLVK